MQIRRWLSQLRQTEAELVAQAAVLASVFRQQLHIPPPEPAATAVHQGRRQGLYRLLDLCALARTLIGDTDSLYCAGDFNDRLVLGLAAVAYPADSSDHHR